MDISLFTSALTEKGAPWSTTWIWPPSVSIITETQYPFSSFNLLIFLITSRCHSQVLWHILSLATFIPLDAKFSKSSNKQHAGPIVHTSLVFLIPKNPFSLNSPSETTSNPKFPSTLLGNWELFTSSKPTCIVARTPSFMPERTPLVRKQTPETRFPKPVPGLFPMIPCINTLELDATAMDFWMWNLRLDLWSWIRKWWW